MYLTSSEAATYLKVALPTIYGWVHAKTIPYRKHGSKLVFSKNDLDLWSDKKEVNELAESYCTILRKKPKSTNNGHLTVGSLKIRQKAKVRPSKPRKVKDGKQQEN